MQQSQSGSRYLCICLVMSVRYYVDILIIIYFYVIMHFLHRILCNVYDLNFNVHLHV